MNVLQRYFAIRKFNVKPSVAWEWAIKTQADADERTYLRSVLFG